MTNKCIIKLLKYTFWGLYCLMSTTNTHALTPDTVTIPISAQAMAIDEVGNLYLQLSNNDLVKYALNGDSLGSFKNTANGAQFMVNTTNPLSTLLYYPTYQKALLLDQQLAVKNEIDFKNLGLFTLPVLTQGLDNALWLYDGNTNKLKKIDQNLHLITEGNDLFQELGYLPHPNFITIKNATIYLCDTLNGLLTFDQFGNFTNRFPTLLASSLQVQDQQIIYFQKDTLHSYSLANFSEHSLPLLPNTHTALYFKGKIITLLTDKIVIYTQK